VDRDCENAFKEVLRAELVARLTLIDPAIVEQESRTADHSSWQPDRNRVDLYSNPEIVTSGDSHFFADPGSAIFRC